MSAKDRGVEDYAKKAYILVFLAYVARSTERIFLELKSSNAIFGRPVTVEGYSTHSINR